ncbi:hypothetical protein G6F56_007450 [Rhizopus delemar]|nr:hypothetical protein G6F56_007450 [Rhizopus delemar]
MNKPQPQSIQKLQQKSSNEQLETARKRSFSTSSTDSPSTFSNYFSDNGASPMTSTDNHLNKKHITNAYHSGSSSSGDNSSNISQSIFSGSSLSSSSNTTQKSSAQRNVSAFLNKLYK